MELVVAQLLLKSFLKEDFNFTPYNTISYLVAGPLMEGAQFGSDVIEIPRPCGLDDNSDKGAPPRKRPKKRSVVADEEEPVPKKRGTEYICID